MSRICHGAFQSIESNAVFYDNEAGIAHLLLFVPGVLAALEFDQHIPRHIESLSDWGVTVDHVQDRIFHS